MSDIQCCHQIKVLTGQIPGPMGDLTEDARKFAEETKANAEQASINAQSVNIRTFANIEEMKQVSNLKAGALVKTQGFYQVNDGGGADYVIVDDISENEADEASIIALQNKLYAKLLIKDYINTKQFGAYGDNTHDDTNAIQKALNYCKNNAKKYILNADENINWNGTNFSEGLVLFFSKGMYKVSSTLYVDVDNTSILSAGAFINYIGTTSCLGIISSYSPQKGTAVTDYTRKIEGLFLIAQQSKNSYETIGIDFSAIKEGYSTQTNDLTINNCVILGFNNATKIENDDYAISFNKVHFGYANKAVYSPKSSTNSGENISFHNCTFDHCDMSLVGENDAVHFYLDRCSIDYGKYDIVLSNSAVCVATQCHFEWNIQENQPKFLLSGGDTLFIAVGCFFLGMSDTYNYDNPANGSFINITDDIKDVEFDNCEFGRIYYKRFSNGAYCTINNPKPHHYYTLPCPYFSVASNSNSGRIFTTRWLYNTIHTDNIKIETDETDGTMRITKTTEGEASICFYARVKNNYRLPFYISIKIPTETNNISLRHALGYVEEAGFYNNKYRGFIIDSDNRTDINLSNECNKDISSYHSIKGGTDFRRKPKIGNADTEYVSVSLLLDNLDINKYILVNEIDIGANYV